MPQLGADLIAVEGAPAAQAVERVTSAFLIVMATVADPVGSGLVARPAELLADE